MENKKEYNLSGIDDTISVVVTLLNEGKHEWQRIMMEVGKIGKNLEGLKENHERLTDRVYQTEDWNRKAFPQSIAKVFISVVQKYFNGRCPCCGETYILNSKGVKVYGLEIDHFKGPKWNKITEGWPICEHCHKKLTHGYLSRDGWVLQAFRAFQMRVNQYVSGNNRQNTLF